MINTNKMLSSRKWNGSAQLQSRNSSQEDFVSSASALILFANCFLEAEGVLYNENEALIFIFVSSINNKCLISLE